MSVPSKVPILTYHSLDDSGSVVSVAPALFRAHMQHLARRGYTGVRLDALLDAWSGSGSLPEKPVVLTFDDGFANLLQHGAPVLSELGFGATVFVVSGRCGAASDWPGQSAQVPVLPLLSWEGVAELAAGGFEVGSHTLGHARLDLLGADEARAELADSKAQIEDRLGRPVRSFAYPCGDFSPLVVDLVRELYEGACSVRLGTAHRDDDRHLLPRLDVYYLRELAVFRRFGTPVGAAYLALRGLGRSLRGLLSRE
jgi:peptidoglycan/xylan/chitin deacetylase (PgdA/CDA1 family)